MALFGNSTRKPVRVSVKKEVYVRAGGKCEKCGLKIPWGGRRGTYHHDRDPTISPTAKTVEFLCQNCHAKYGHHFRTRVSSSLFGSEKQVIIKRKKVSERAKKDSKKEKPKTRRVAIRSILGDVIGYRTVKLRRKKT